MAVSLTPNSALIGSIITASICRPTKLSANTMASSISKPWLPQPTLAGGSMPEATFIAVPTDPASRDHSRQSGA